MGLRKKKTLMDQAADIVEAILPTIEGAVDTAREKAVPLLTDARDRAVPLIHEARESARPILAQGKAVAAEKAAAGAALAADKVAQLKGEPPKKKKRGRLKKLLMLGGIAGLATLLYKKLSASDDSWQTSYNPAPPPRPASTPPTPATAPAPAGNAPDDVAEEADDQAENQADDQAGATPDEAIADVAEEPHEVTTPDEPAEVVELEAEKPEAR
jgi:hypothetical protein